jgi:hypothetical protein
MVINLKTANALLAIAAGYRVSGFVQWNRAADFRAGAIWSAIQRTSAVSTAAAARW